MTDLSLRLPHAGALFDIILDDITGGGLFVAGGEHVAAGERVSVRVDVGQETFQLRGRVVWRRMRPGGRFMRKGAAVAFDQDQGKAVKRLFALAREPVASIARRETPRRPVALTIKYHSKPGMLRDLSLGGLRIHAANPPAVGEVVKISLRPPRALLPLKLEAIVVWSEPAGHDPGFGVRFTKTTPRDKRRLQRLLDAAVPR